jgi:protein tyrosine phosphatase (PTP) superfamily phosphohydrolase (DUF442 family)
MAELEKMKRTEMSAAEPQNAVGNPNQAAQPQNAIGSPSVSDKSPNLMQQHQQQRLERFNTDVAQVEQRRNEAAQRTNAAANPDQAAALQSAQQELAAKQQALSSMQTTPAAGQAQAAVSRQYQAAQPQQRALTPPVMDFAPDTPSPNRATSEELYGPRSLSQSQSISYSETSGGGKPLERVDTWEMERNLKEANEAAKKQQTAAIDQATRANAEQLRIAEREAQAQYDEQRRQTSLDERQAMDNSALYAAARGDRGGVGQAQYNAIQANAARNRASIGQAQTKLSTDVTRQIADLRRQGEFKKADALLTLSQQYLSQLNDLKRWATETNLTVDQANNALAQWERGFEMDLAGITGQYQGQDTLQKAQIDYQRGQDAINNAIREAGLTGMYKGQATMEKAQIDLANARYEDETAYQRGQDAINNAIREAGLTGMYNGQKTVAQQQYEDETAYQRGQDAINNAIREAGLTGMYNGQKTVAQQQYEDETAYQRGQDAINNAIREAGLTGMYNGQKTVAQQQYEDETAYQRGQDALDTSIRQRELDANNGWTLLQAGQMPNATQLKAMDWTSGQAQKYINDAKALKAATDAASAAGDVSKVANLGWKSLDAGIMPSAAQLAAMEMSQADAQARIDRILGKESSSTTTTTTNNTSTQKTDDYDGLFSAAAKAQSPENYIASHYKEYGFNSATGLADAFTTYQKKTTAQQDNPANVSMGVIDPVTNRMITRADPRVVNITYDSQGRSVYHLKDGRVLTDTLGGKDTSKIPGKNVATYLK